MKAQQTDKIPEIYCAISLSFNKDIDTFSISNDLKKFGIQNIEIHKPKCEPIVCIDIAIIKNEPFWYLDEALTKMFLQVENRLTNIKEIIEKFHGKVCIDVAFYHYGTYPALKFSGENMKKIRYLEADISIDPY